MLELAVLVVAAFGLFFGGMAAERRQNGSLFSEWQAAHQELRDCREEVRRLVQVRP